ncbi:tail completion protein gp17 [Allosphingosinicella sp.]|uniref:tail completion protein gp17 n=1 Tax=Allosphingosinicella sp. TaxID=2823234 RepID=UPI003D716BE9
MRRMGAGEALQAAAATMLKAVPGIGAVYEGAPRRAAFPHAVVDGGVETDWGHKSGAGREVRFAFVLRDGGERAARLRELASEAAAGLEGLGRELPDWIIVSLGLLRSRIVPDGTGWTAVIEYRARMLRR